jgi:hypothetical protein
LPAAHSWSAFPTAALAVLEICHSVPTYSQQKRKKAFKNNINFKIKKPGNSHFYPYNFMGKLWDFTGKLRVRYGVTFYP